VFFRCNEIIGNLRLKTTVDRLRLDEQLYALKGTESSTKVLAGMLPLAAFKMP